VTLPDDPRVRDLTVRIHNLADYEDLCPEKKSDETTDPTSENDDSSSNSSGSGTGSSST
jgi:hypothetical protein